MLYGSPESIDTRVNELLDKVGRQHICNLGHGVYPDTPLDNVKQFINSVKSYRYS